MRTSQFFNCVAVTLFVSGLVSSINSASPQEKATTAGALQSEHAALRKAERGSGGQESGTETQRAMSAKGVELTPTVEAMSAKNRDYHGPEWSLVWVTVGLGTITAVLAIFTALLWRSTKELVERSDVTARTHERAYLFGGLQPTGDTHAVLTCRNEGRTLGFTKAVQWGIWPEDEFPATISVSDIFDGAVSLPLPLTRVTYEEVIRVEGRETQIWAVRIECAGTQGKILFGRIWYEDVFKSTHYSTFKYRLAVLEPTSVKIEPLEGCYTDWT